MSTPGGYRTPKARGALGSLRSDAAPPPTPTTNIRNLIVAKEKELVALSEQRMGALNSRTRDVEERLRARDAELATVKQQFQQLTTDFKYNLKLVGERDAELVRLDAAVASSRAAVEKAEVEAANAKSACADAQGELRREKARIEELEAYHKEKVSRLQKNADDARYAREDELARQKDDFQALERQLLRQLEEQKNLLETQRMTMLEEAARNRDDAESAAREPVARLEAELQTEKANVVGLGKELDAERARAEELTREIAALRETMPRERARAEETFREKESAATAAIAANHREIDELKLRVRTLQAANEDLKESAAEASDAAKKNAAALRREREERERVENDAYDDDDDGAFIDEGFFADAAGWDSGARAARVDDRELSFESHEGLAPGATGLTPPRIGAERPEVLAARAGAAAARAEIERARVAEGEPTRMRTDAEPTATTTPTPTTRARNCDTVRGYWTGDARAPPSAMYWSEDGPGVGVDASAATAPNANANANANANRRGYEPTSSSPGGVSREVIEAAARLAVEAALAAAAGGRASAAPSPSPERPPRARRRAEESFQSRSRLLEARDSIERMSIRPPAVTKTAKRKKKIDGGAKGAKGAARARRAAASAATRSLESRQAAQLAALEADVEALTACRRGRTHMTSLKSYFA